MQNIDKKQTVVITDRKQVEIDGAECVLALDEDHISLDTSLGKIVV